MTGHQQHDRTQGDNTLFQRIIVPLDESLRAEKAIHGAAHVARASEGTVILVQAISPAADLRSSAPVQTNLTEIERFRLAERQGKIFRW